MMTKDMPVQLYEWIKSVIDSTPGLTQKGLAEAMDVNPAAVNRMLYGARKIKVDEMPAIEAYLGQSFKSASYTSREATGNIPPSSQMQEIYGAGQIPGFRERPGAPYRADAFNWAETLLPVYGYAVGGLKTGLNLKKGEIVDWVVRHPALNGIRDAFAIYIRNSELCVL